MINPFDYLDNPQADADLASKIAESFNEPVNKTFFGDVSYTISSLELAKIETTEESDLVAVGKILLLFGGLKLVIVYHALCLRDIDLGNIIRKRNHFLCGMNDSGLDYVVRVSAKISCSRCQQIRKQYDLEMSSDSIFDRVSHD